MKLLYFILALSLISSAHAEDPIAHPVINQSPPVIYTRTILKFIPKHAHSKVETVKEVKEEKQGDSKPTEILPSLPRVAKEFDVEVRPLGFLAQHDFLAHQPFTDKGGMLILIDPPQRIALTSTNLLAKVDVLFVTEDGLITQIAPDVLLPGLQEPIDTENPIHAFIFLKAGMAKASDIEPGDHVESTVFKTHPVLLEEKTEPAPITR